VSVCWVYEHWLLAFLCFQPLCSTTGHMVFIFTLKLLVRKEIWWRWTNVQMPASALSCLRFRFLTNYFCFCYCCVVIILWMYRCQSAWWPADNSRVSATLHWTISVHCLPCQRRTQFWASFTRCGGSRAARYYYYSVFLRAKAATAFSAS